ncbi:MAG TPA: hypothetical protein VMV32_12380 [Ignavibacteriaceae bacterium]|nr:hypothetical protein [Ignavibacteriaceae bacterium]
MATGFPDFQSRAFTSADNFEQQKISATAVESTNSFTQEVKSVLIYNDGVNPVHLNFDDTATTNLMKLLSKAWLMIDLKLTDIHAICSAGQTATLYCIGTY